MGAGLDFDGVGAAGGADEAFLIDQPVVFSIEWLTARQRTRWSGGLRWSRAGGGRSVGLVRRALDIRNKTFDVEQPVVGADHELRGHAVLLGQAARLVMCPFRPATARALASNALFTVRVPPESWTSDEPAAQHDRSVQSPWS